MRRRKRVVMSSNDRLIESLRREFPGVEFVLAAAGTDGRHAVIIDGQISNVLMMGEEDVRKLSAMFGDITEEEIVSSVLDQVRRHLDPELDNDDDELDLLDIDADDIIEIAKLGDTIDLADLDEDDILPFPFTD